MRFSDAVRVVLASGTGKAGISLLAILVAISVAVPFFFPLDFGLRSWNNPVVWADNPKAVPPVWTALVDGSTPPRHRVFETDIPTSVLSQDRFATRTYEFPFTYHADTAPTFLSLSLGSMSFYDGPLP